MRYYYQDIVEILNIGTQDWNLGDPAERIIGQRFYVEWSLPETVVVKVYSTRNGGQWVEAHFNPTQVRLYKRPMKNWLRYLKRSLTERK